MPKEVVKIRPYARLLTMLGEQLIKNEQIALAELIKNAYDADADWVKISFVNFDEKKDDKTQQISYSSTPKSKIIIEDNGCGMDESVIKKSWMNPATPNKKVASNTDSKTIHKQRVVQGEKGIGRFAIFKLGKNVTITTRPENKNDEYVIEYDFSVYDDEFLTENSQEKELFLDQIGVLLEKREPSIIVDREILNIKEPKDVKKGTRIEISGLKGEWTIDKITAVMQESEKLQSVFDKVFNKQSQDSIEIRFEINGHLPAYSSAISQLSDLLQNSSVFKITQGKYDEEKQLFSYQLNGTPMQLSFTDPRFTDLSVFREYFARDKDIFGNPIIKPTTCGDFKFNFFVFDFDADKDSKYYLDKQDKNLIKEHRIYLYRDKVRVAPYGDSDNDWVETDKKRATGKAGDYLSNDQVVGFVDITKQGNPKLRDKTNREGLIEEGTATRDFIMVLHSFLWYIRQHPYKQYQELKKKKKEREDQHKNIVQGSFDDLKNAIGNNPAAQDILETLNKSYKAEKAMYANRISYVEDLAAVGLSVETASHDLMMLLSLGITNLDTLIEQFPFLSEEERINSLKQIKDTLALVRENMRNTQLLFKSSRRKHSAIDFNELLDKVIRIYQRTLQREGILLDVVKKGNPIIISCVDAVILQTLVNLFDNAIYWMKMIPQKQIKILIDGNTNTVVFADNGPGIPSESLPFLFEPFYSTKEEGRGLGLYIARQLLNRLDYSIDVLISPEHKVLDGANFIIDFNKQQDNDIN